jgi:hypothetical protein
MAVRMASMWVDMMAERSADMKAGPLVLLWAGTSVEWWGTLLAAHLVVKKVGHLVEA